ncbi:MAG: ADP-ribosylglycohydrolase family protein [Clostridia bacterium]|nr:ADP-ribosylglycohydrolase family protein [Clostridia bacterium]
MIGALIGDIVGSRFEWINIKEKQFQLFHDQCRPTDDSVMTLAVAKALLKSPSPEVLPQTAVICMQELGRKYPHAGYGGTFAAWLVSDEPRPYGSWGNGAGMRVSPCAWAGKTLEEALRLSDAVTGVTHSHPEGLKGARAITAAVFLARHGKTQSEIRQHIRDNYYPLDFTLDEIRPAYRFDVSCQGSVPQAIEAFLESTSFEDAVRGAVSIGGDSDTIGCMAGAIAESYWGVPESIRARALDYLDDAQRDILLSFEKTYGKKTVPDAGA